MGRDPYFAPWPDVVQLDPTNPGLRQAVIDTLSDIASQCDGVRCDMAMLPLDDVVARTWGDRVGPPLPEPYWTEVTRRVRAAHPDFLFAAEAYWDRESDLVAQGFDHCYDKRLYDRWLARTPARSAAHLGADPAYQHHLVRFLENHDEPRAAATFPPDRGRAAGVVVATVPGALCSSRASWPDGGTTTRSRKPGGPTTPPTRPPRPGGGPCWPPWPTTGSGPASGACSRWAGGPTTGHASG